MFEVFVFKGAAGNLQPWWTKAKYIIALQSHRCRLLSQARLHLLHSVFINLLCGYFEVNKHSLFLEPLQTKMEKLHPKRYLWFKWWHGCSWSFSLLLIHLFLFSFRPLVLISTSMFMQEHLWSSWPPQMPTTPPMATVLVWSTASWRASLTSLWMPSLVRLHTCCKTPSKTLNL